jgi:O-antigen/teichoic acid export membrane protein
VIELQRDWRRFEPLAWNLIAAASGQGATLVLTLFLANALGPAQFGRFAVATSTILALSALAQFGLGFTATNFVARYVAADRARAARIAALCVAGASTAGLLLGSVLILGSWIVATYLYGDPTLFPLLIVAGAGIPAATLGLVQNAILIGLQAFRPLAMNAIVYAILVLLGAFVGYSFGGPLGAAMGYVVSVTLRVLHGAYLLKRVFAPLRPWRWPDESRVLLKELAPFALPAGLAGLTLTPALWLANAWLVNIQGLRELGLFLTAFTIKTLVVFVPIQIGTVFLPRYVALGADDAVAANRYLRRVSLMVFAFSGGVAATVAFIAPWLMTLFGPEFAAGTTALRWLMASVVAESVATIGSYRFAGDRRMWTSLLAYTLPKDVTLIIAALFLAPQYGASGLAGAHFLSWLYAVLVVLALSTRPPSLGATGSTGIGG